MKKKIVVGVISLSLLGLVQPIGYAEQQNNTVSSSTKAAESEKPTTTTKNEQKDNKDNSVQKNQPTTETPTTHAVEEPKKEGWIQENNNWRFYENNKPVLNWKKINHQWYYFNKDGVMLSNEIFDHYLLTDSGRMAENAWTYMNGKWYYSLDNGRIVEKSWKKINGAWYYFNEKGIMLSNTIVDGYLLKSSGAMAENTWVLIDGKWYYADQDGKVIKQAWKKINGAWYYFNNAGVMLSNQWQGSYYLKSSGAMAESEWIFDKDYNSWFYLKSSGAYAAREWIGAYYLKSGGYMAKSEWIFDPDYNSWYYLKEDGQYVTGTYTINDKQHFFRNDGRWVSEMPKGFKKGQYTYTVFLDPGHGGRDSGAYYYNTAEKDLTMQVYRKLRTKLEGLGYNVLSSRDSDVYVDYVTERSQIANSTNSDFFISIHFNASGSIYSQANGIQTYAYEEEAGYPSKINQFWHNNPDRISESDRLARDIHYSLLDETGAKDAGLLHSSFAVLRETSKPAVLLELGYIDNFNENQKVRSDAYQDRLVAGIVKGIQKYYAGK